MALPAVPWLLLLSLLAAVKTPVPCACQEVPPTAGSLLIQCYDTPTNATNGTEFRDGLLPLLAALPSAAAHTGFASLWSNRSVFVRGLCFGDATVPSECLGCLSVAAANLTSGCGSTTRRAGIWNAGCFVAYADTNTSSPAEDAYRSRVLLRVQGDANATYNASHLHARLVDMAQGVAQSAAANISGSRMLATADDVDIPAGYVVKSTVHVLAQCAGWDRTAAECVRCLQESARAVDWDLDADRRDGGVAAAVLGFNCYLRFSVSTALVPQNTESDSLIIAIIFVGCIAIALAVDLCILRCR